MKQVTVFTVVAFLILTMNSAIAGTVTVTSPGTAGKVLRGTAVIAPDGGKDNEQRICAACHGLHKQKDNRQFNSIKVVETSGKGICTYKKEKLQKII